MATPLGADQRLSLVVGCRKAEDQIGEGETPGAGQERGDPA